MGGDHGEKTVTTGDRDWRCSNKKKKHVKKKKWYRAICVRTYAWRIRTRNVKGKSSSPRNAFSEMLPSLYYGDKQIYDSNKDTLLW